MKASRHPEEYLALARQRSTAQVETVCRELRDRHLTVLQASTVETSEVKSVDLTVGTYLGSRFNCLVTISLSHYGNLCLVSHAPGRTTLPDSVDLDTILFKAGWLQVPDEDITTTLNESTDADVMGTFFNMF